MLSFIRVAIHFIMVGFTTFNDEIGILQNGPGPPLRKLQTVPSEGTESDTKLQNHGLSDTELQDHDPFNSEKHMKVHHGIESIILYKFFKWFFLHLIFELHRCTSDTQLPHIDQNIFQYLTLPEQSSFLILLSKKIHILTAKKTLPQSYFSLVDKRGKSFIHYLIEYHQWIIFDNLFITNFDLFLLRDNENKTISHYITDYNQWNIYQDLTMNRNKTLTRLMIYNIHTLDKYGRSPLHYSILRNSIDTFDILLSYGSYLSRGDIHTDTPLQYAMMFQQKYFIKKLRAEVGIQPHLMYNNSHHTFNSTDLSVSHRLYEELTQKIYHSDLLPERILHHLNQKTFQKLNLQEQNHFLILLAKKLTVSLIERVLESGGHFDLVQHDGKSLMHYLIEYRAITLFTKLASSGITLHRRDQYQKTLAHYAIDYNQIDILEIIHTIQNHQESIWDLNTPDDTGRSPLHYTILKNNINTFKKLLSLGVKVNVYDVHGDTPLHYVILTDKIDFLDTLLQYDVNVNAYNFMMQSPLHYSCNEGRMWKQLIKAGANVHARDADGKSVVQVALESHNSNYLKIIRALIKAGVSIDNRFHQYVLDNCTNDDQAILIPLIQYCKDRINLRTDSIHTKLSTEHLKEERAQTNLQTNTTHTEKNTEQLRGEQSLNRTKNNLQMGQKQFIPNSNNNNSNNNKNKIKIIRQNINLSMGELIGVLSYLIKKKDITSIFLQFCINLILRIRLKKLDGVCTGHDSVRIPTNIPIKDNYRLDKYKNIKYSFLTCLAMKALYFNNNDAFQIIIDIINRDVSWQLSSYYNLLLHHVSIHNTTIPLQILLEMDLPIIDNSTTLLGFDALSHNRIDNFRLLIQDGCIRIPSMYATYLIILSIVKKRKDALQVLLDRGIDSNIPFKNKYPLFIAVKDGWHAGVSLLLQAGALINQKNEDGDTVLHIAVRQSNRQMTRFLLLYGALRNIKNNDGITPHDLALKNPVAILDFG